jgi:uncharacterized protein
MKIEVAYATPQEQVIIEIELPAGSSIAQAIAASGLLARFPAIDPSRDGVGIFGEMRTLSDTVSEGDRVEIYRALKANPKEQRRARARKKRR